MMPPECTAATAHVCPECKEGKHGNCDGAAWCNAFDFQVQCVCAAVRHIEAV